MQGTPKKSKTHCDTTSSPPKGGSMPSSDGGSVASPSASLEAIATKEVTYTVVVKKCLMKALNPNLLPYQRSHFIDLVDQYTDLASRLARRASLMFLYYVVRTHEDGHAQRDFESEKDAYWKSWLRVGLQEFNHEMPSSDVIPYFEEVREWLGTSVVNDVPPFFDRVLGHLAITFKTTVLNNQKVHFIDKLKRLCKYAAQENDDKDITGYSVLSAVRHDDVPSTWTDTLRSFVKEVRGRLNLVPGDVLYDDTEVNVVTRFDFHWWMQQQFASLGEHKIMLSPVFKVTRLHVRLDATMLFMLAHHCFEPPKPEDLVVEKPKASEYPTAKEFKKAKDERRAVLKAHEQTIAEYKMQLERFKNENPSYSELQKTNPTDPRTVLNSEHPQLTIGKKPKNMSDDDWKRAREARKLIVDDVRRLRETIRASSEFQDSHRMYLEYEKKVHEFGSRLFRPFDDKNAKHGWQPSMSVATDGVSVSITYEKTVTVPVIAGGKKARKKRAADDEPPPHDDYDPDASTIVGDILVLGIDPGRTHIVTVMCIDANGKRHFWHLSRGQYYTDGCITRETRRQVRRYAPLEQSFAAITNGGGAVRASSSAEVRRYLLWSSRCEDRWWSLALSRAESRSKMQRYIGKKKVIARFFANLHRSAKKLLRDGQRIDVAYGAAGMSFASTGRGEVAVPTKGTFRACQVEFGKPNVVLEPEHNTSKKSWETQKPYEIVFKRPRGGKEVLDHTSSRRTPFVTEADAAEVTASVQRARSKAQRRRGGTGIVRPPKGVRSGREKDKKKARYMECRGLRFCPERRMYFDRDEASARAIAGLRCLELMGLGRPRAFSPLQKQAQNIIGGSQYDASASALMRLSDGASGKESRGTVQSRKKGTCPKKM